MKKILYLSYLRAAACISIIVLHTVDVAVILYQEQISNGERLASLSVVHCMMWAVPCFVMVTGALLLDKDRTISIRDIFLKYILRIIIALVAFSLIFALFDTLMDKSGTGFGFLAKGLSNVLTGNGWAHVWYLYLLIGLYLLMIFYRAAANHVSNAEYRYLLAVYVVFLSILPLLSMWNAKAGFYIHVSTIYPFYLFAGYAIATQILKIKRWLSILLSLVGIAGVIAATILNEYCANISYGNLLGYSSIFVLLMSVGIFSLARGDKNRMVPDREQKKPHIIGKVFLEIDRCSFGIYLIHMIFVRLTLRYWAINPYSSNLTILIFIGLILGILVVSYGITALLKFIPGVRKIL